jgi:hypothetical protein
MNIKLDTKKWNEIKCRGTKLKTQTSKIIKINTNNNQINED